MAKIEKKDSKIFGKVLLKILERKINHLLMQWKWKEKLQLLS